MEIGHERFLSNPYSLLLMVIFISRFDLKEMSAAVSLYFGSVTTAC